MTSGPAHEMAKEMRGMSGTQRVFGNATAAEMALNKGVPATVSIVLAAGAANGMLITVTVKDAAGNPIAAVHRLALWMSADSGGAGLTSQAYSGTLVASTGALLTTLTTKKEFAVVTAATGIFAGTLTDTAKPATEYVAVTHPFTGKAIVSAASGTSWG